MKDASDNEYETVLIGNQCWTKTNLRVKPAGATDGTASGASSATDPYYYVNSDVNAATYGYYYNWAAAKLACPSGWHLPSDEEWTVFENYLKTQCECKCNNNENFIAKAITSTNGWKVPAGDNVACMVGKDADANNVTGFSAVPAGIRIGSRFSSFGENTYFWSSKQNDSDYAYPRNLFYNHPGVCGAIYEKSNGFSVRCLRD